MRRKARRRHRGGRLRVGLDQRNDDALGAGVERLADRDRAGVRGAHQHRHAVGDEADRVFESLLRSHSPCCASITIASGAASRGDLHHGGRAGAHPEHAERQIARETCTQAERTEIEHPALRTQQSRRPDIVLSPPAGQGFAARKRDAMVTAQGTMNGLGFRAGLHRRGEPRREAVAWAEPRGARLGRRCRGWRRSTSMRRSPAARTIRSTTTGRGRCSSRCWRFRRARRSTRAIASAEFALEPRRPAGGTSLHRLRFERHFYPVGGETEPAPLHRAVLLCGALSQAGRGRGGVHPATTSTPIRRRWQACPASVR